MSSLASIAYCAILRLHPYQFRAEFGDEMLWIFHEELQGSESRVSRAARLLFDGLRSVVVQHTLRPRQQQQAVVAGPYYHEIDSTLPAERIANAWLITLSCSLSLSLFMSMMVPGVAMPIGRLLYAEVQQLASPPASQLHKPVHATPR